VAGVKAFHSTPRAWVKVGDAVPDVELMEGSPGSKVSLAQELKSGRGVIVGVPAAFSTEYSAPLVYIIFFEMHVY
jgi:2-Cys peroxiredoxin 5